MGSSTAIEVDTEAIESTRIKIDTLRREFASKHKAVYDLRDQLENTWAGEDSTEYHNKLEEFRNDFADLDEALENYSRFLDNSKKKYDAAQDELARQAKTLAGDRR